MYLKALQFQTIFWFFWSILSLGILQENTSQKVQKYGALDPIGLFSIEDYKTL